MTASRSIRHVLVVAAMLVAGWGCAPAGSSEGVVLWRVPDAGRLPRAVIDDAGTVHLVYFQGEPAGGDLVYVTRQRGETTWSDPQYVNSEPQTVTGVGPIDGGQIALGKSNRLHVAWFRIRPTEFFYTRTNPQGTAFEPQFGLAAADGVEAAPSLAVDDDGNVFMFWHAGAIEDADRAVYVAVSHDEGTIWEPPRRVNAKTEGVCNCCGLHALNDAGALYLSYRGAGDNERRGQRLLASSDGGHTFSDDLIHPWELRACPVSTTTLSQGSAGTTVAWETQGQVYFAEIARLEARVSPAGIADTRRKNPSVAVNHRGETILAWGDGPGLRSGGTLYWQVFDAEHAPVSGQAGGSEMIPEGSVAIALAQPDGTFVVIF